MPQDMGTIWVCVDCYMTHVNGAASDDPDYTPDREPLSLVGDRVTVTAGVAKHECETDEDGYPVGDECGCDRMEFSWAVCHGCGSILGGSREALTVWVES